MSALTLEITETLKSLDPKRAQALERAIHDLLIVVRPDAKSDGDTPPLPITVDDKGWPIGYWEKFAGCLEGETWDPSPDPPPEPHPW